MPVWCVLRCLLREGWLEGKRQRRKEGRHVWQSVRGGWRSERWRDAVALGQAVPWEAEEEQGGASPMTLRLWTAVLEQMLGDHTQGILGNPNTPGSQEAPTRKAYHDRVAGSI